MTVQSIGAWSCASVTTRSPASMWPLTRQHGVRRRPRPPPAPRTAVTAFMTEPGSKTSETTGLPSSVGVGRRVVARVVAGAGAHRDDLAGVHVEDDGRGRGWWRRPRRPPRAAARVTYCRSWSRVSVHGAAVGGRGGLVDARRDRVAAAAHLDPALARRCRPARPGRSARCRPARRRRGRRSRRPGRRRRRPGRAAPGRPRRGRPESSRSSMASVVSGGTWAASTT